MATQKIHVCIYNSATKEIEGAETYPTQEKAHDRWSMFECECRARGGDWHPYISEEPFAFPVEPEPEEKPLA